MEHFYDSLLLDFFEALSKMPETFLFIMASFNTRELLSFILEPSIYDFYFYKLKNITTLQLLCLYNNNLIFVLQPSNFDY